MSLLCGVYLRRADVTFPSGWDLHLPRNLNRGAAGMVSECRDERLLLYKLDLGAFDAPASKVGASLESG